MLLYETWSSPWKEEEEEEEEEGESRFQNKSTRIELIYWLLNYRGT
jgi:hypothetical protein